MLDFETIDVTVDERGVATVTLSRPEKHNAMNAKMIAELSQAIDHISASSDIRAVVLTATGKSFCAGADLAWMKEQASADRAEKEVQSRALATMLTAFDALNKPVIGKIAGNAFGGGIGLISICDLVFAKAGNRMVLTETKLGLIPATIGPFVSRAMGVNFARQIFFTGREIDDDLAVRSGLVTEICTDENIDEVVEAAILKILDTAPNAVSRAKKLLAELTEKPRSSQLDFTASALSDCWEDPQTQSRINTFLNKS